MKKVLKYIILFILILLFLILLPLDLDEIWNYGFIHNIANGLIPYKDFNMVITPFFVFLFSLPIYLFGSNLLFIHIEQALMILMTYYFLEKYYPDKANFFILLLFLLWNCIYPSYNSFLLFLTIIVVVLEKQDKNDYLIGILLGLLILTKQSVGIIIVLLQALFYRKSRKKLLKRLIGIMIPILIFIIYLLLTKSLEKFIDLCILGLFDFGNKNRLSFNYVYILCFLFFLGLIIMIKKEKKIEYFYTLAFLSINIPMFDIGHFRYFFLLFCLWIVIPKIVMKKNIHHSLLCYVSMILILVFVYINDYHEENNFYYPNQLNHFEYKYISKKHEKQTQEILSLMKKYHHKNMILISRSAYFYKLISDVKITHYDLINTGNWGLHGSKKLKEHLKKEKDTIYIVSLSSFNKNEQTDKTALDFIQKECDIIEKYQDFVVYKTRK